MRTHTRVTVVACLTIALVSVLGAATIGTGYSFLGEPQIHEFRDAPDVIGAPAGEVIELGSLSLGGPCDPIEQTFLFMGSSGIDYTFNVQQLPLNIELVEIEVDSTASGTGTYATEAPGTNVDVAALWWLNGEFINAPFTLNRSHINLTAPGFGIENAGTILDFVTYNGDFDACVIPAGSQVPCTVNLSTAGTGTGGTNDGDPYEGTGTTPIVLDPTNWWSAQTGSGTVSLTESSVQGVVIVRLYPCITPPGTTCDFDLSHNGTVDVDDLLLIVFDWGCAGSCIGDANGDGIVNVQDLADLIRNWGPCQSE